MAHKRKVLEPPAADRVPWPKKLALRPGLQRVGAVQQQEAREQQRQPQGTAAQAASNISSTTAVAEFLTRAAAEKGEVEAAAAVAKAAEVAAQVEVVEPSPEPAVAVASEIFFLAGQQICRAAEEWVLAGETLVSAGAAMQRMTQSLPQSENRMRRPVPKQGSLGRVCTD